MNYDEAVAKAQDYIDDNLIECCKELIEYEQVKSIKINGYLAFLDLIMSAHSSPTSLFMRMIRTSAMKALVEEYDALLVPDQHA